MNKLIYLFMITFLLLSCSETSKNNSIEEKGKSHSKLIQQYQRIDSLNATGVFQTDEYHHLITHTLDFYDKYPEDQATPMLLWNSGIAAMTIAKYLKEYQAENLEEITFFANKGIELFSLIQKVYPDYQESKSAHLNKGIIYDDILDDYEKAKDEYSEYIRKIPNDSISENLKQYIQFLGKSPDEILESFTLSED